jgi:hypothetical protein
MQIQTGSHLSRRDLLVNRKTLLLKEAGNQGVEGEAENDAADAERNGILFADHATDGDSRIRDHFELGFHLQMKTDSGSEGVGRGPPRSHYFGLMKRTNAELPPIDEERPHKIARIEDAVSAFDCVPNEILCLILGGAVGTKRLHDRLMIFVCRLTCKRFDTALSACSGRSLAVDVCRNGIAMAWWVDVFQLRQAASMNLIPEFLMRADFFQSDFRRGDSVVKATTAAMRQQCVIDGAITGKHAELARRVIELSGSLFSPTHSWVMAQAARLKLGGEAMRPILKALSKSGCGCSICNCVDEAGVFRVAVSVTQIHGFGKPVNFYHWNPQSLPLVMGKGWAITDVLMDVISIMPPTASILRVTSNLGVFVEKEKMQHWLDVLRLMDPAVPMIEFVAASDATGSDKSRFIECMNECFQLVALHAGWV